MQTWLISIMHQWSSHPTFWSINQIKFESMNFRLNGTFEYYNTVKNWRRGRCGNENDWKVPPEIAIQYSTISYVEIINDKVIQIYK